MNLEINEMTMEVTNINTGTENHGDEVVLATDISLLANLPVEALSKFSDTDKDWEKIWKSLLWNKKGEITGHCLSHIEFQHEFVEHIVRIHDEDGNVMEFSEARIRKFMAVPLPGYRISLKFQARVHPDKRQNGELTALQKEDTNVEIIGSPQGDLLQDNGNVVDLKDKKGKKE